jgi:hypothetical protein
VLQHNFCIRHGLLVIPSTTWLLLFAGLLQSEVLRAILAVVCIASMVWQWLLYRKTERGAHLVFLTLMVTGFTLASVWLLLNVARYYTYDGESGRSHIYPMVVSTQDKLVWLICVLMVVVSVWALFEFRSLGQRKITK